MPFGTEVTADGTTFSLWAPSANSVKVSAEGREVEMTRHDLGWYRLHLPGVGAGTLYRFRIDNELFVPDPASRFQPQDVEGPSMVVDPAAFSWSDGDWGGRRWEEAVLYEAHVGTATPEGTFAGLMKQLDHLQTLGVTALELLPIADFPGSRNWGYDGVLHYAPDHAYGAPDDLKRLVDRAHQCNIMVFLDVVYNHFGPSGNYLSSYANSFFTERHKTLWGAGINFDGETAETVRDFFVHNALYWLEEFHFDGLRFDAVHAIADDSKSHFIGDLAQQIRAALPHRSVHLVLENNANQARWLERDATGSPTMHTAQWNDDFHHAWHRLLTNEAEGYYVDYEDPLAHLGRCLAEGFAYQGEPSKHDGISRGEPSAHLPPSAFVSFLQNHDQIGNRAFGERLAALADPAKLTLATATLLLSPQIPLLFMGEEWRASAPFQYFVDFADPALSAAVRDGRRMEFAGFGAFNEASPANAIPDPTLSPPFERSCLAWSERERSPHKEALEATRELLGIRRKVIVPLIATEFLGASWARPAPEALDVVWQFHAGQLRLVINVGETALKISVPSAGEVIWSNISMGPGRDIDLTAWSGAMLLTSP